MEQKLQYFIKYGSIFRIGGSNELTFANSFVKIVFDDSDTFVVFNEGSDLIVEQEASVVEIYRADESIFIVHNDTFAVVEPGGELIYLHPVFYEVTVI